jgi:type I restriction enzyme R subunit
VYEVTEEFYVHNGRYGKREDMVFLINGIPNPEPVSKKVREAFAKFPNWQRSEAELRELRKQVTFAIFAEEDDMAKVTATVEALFVLLKKSFRP